MSLLGLEKGGVGFTYIKLFKYLSVTGKKKRQKIR